MAGIGFGVGGVVDRSDTKVASCKYRVPGRMLVRFLFQLPAFCLGAAAAGAPLLLRAQAIAVSEAARGEPTMGPGTFMFLGFLAAVLGGMFALAMATTVLWLYTWWDHSRRERS